MWKFTVLPIRMGLPYHGASVKVSSAERMETDGDGEMVICFVGVCVPCL